MAKWIWTTITFISIMLAFSFLWVVALPNAGQPAPFVLALLLFFAIWPLCKKVWRYHDLQEKKRKAGQMPDEEYLCPNCKVEVALNETRCPKCNTELES